MVELGPEIVVARVTMGIKVYYPTGPSFAIALRIGKVTE